MDENLNTSIPEAEPKNDFENNTQKLADAISELNSVIVDVKNDKEADEPVSYEPAADVPDRKIAAAPSVQPAPAQLQPSPAPVQPQFSRQPAYQPPQTQQPANFQQSYPNPAQNIPQQPINNQNFQVPTKFCKFCGARIPMDAVICTACGRQVEMLSSSQPASQPVYIQNINTNNNNMNGQKPLDKWVAFLLCFFLGWMGAHKFYEGKIGWGLVYLFSFGGLGIGWFLDTIVLLFKPNPYYLK